MCEPVTIALAATALGAASSISEGQGAKQQAKFQATVAQNNAIIASRKADDARRRGEVAQTQEQIRTRQLIGRQRAAAAGAGVEVDTGSALALTEDAARFGRLDELTIRSNAEREALGFEQQSVEFATQGQFLKAAGKQAAKKGFLDAAGQLAGGAGGIASSNPGLFSSSPVTGNLAAAPTTASGVGQSLLSSSSTVNPKWRSFGNPHR